MGIRNSNQAKVFKNEKVNTVVDAFGAAALENDYILLNGMEKENNSQMDNSPERRARAVLRLLNQAYYDNYLDENISPRALYEDLYSGLISPEEIGITPARIRNGTPPQDIVKHWSDIRKEIIALGALPESLKNDTQGQEILFLSLQQSLENDAQTLELLKNRKHKWLFKNMLAKAQEKMEEQQARNESILELLKSENRELNNIKFKRSKNPLKQLGNLAAQKAMVKMVQKSVALAADERISWEKRHALVQNVYDILNINEILLPMENGSFMLQGDEQDLRMALYDGRASIELLKDNTPSEAEYYWKINFTKLNGEDGFYQFFGNNVYFNSFDRTLRVNWKEGDPYADQFSKSLAERFKEKFIPVSE